MNVRLQSEDIEEGVSAKIRLRFNFNIKGQDSLISTFIIYDVIPSRHERIYRSLRENITFDYEPDFSEPDDDQDNNLTIIWLDQHNYV